VKTKALGYLIVLFLFIIAAGAATEIEIFVSKTIEGNLKVTGIQNGTGVLEVNSGFHNTGGLPYMARARIDVIRGEEIIFTGWSEKKKLVSGERKNFKLYWYKPDTRGNFSLVTRIYYGNEISEPLIKNFTINTAGMQDVFTIYDFKTYDDYIRFDLYASKTVKDVVVFPAEYPKGWIFGQTVIDEIKKGKSVEVVLPYQTDIFYTENIKIMVATKDGMYYTQDEFELDRLTGVLKYINLFLDWLKNILR